MKCVKLDVTLSNEKTAYPQAVKKVDGCKQTTGDGLQNEGRCEEEWGLVSKASGGPGCPCPYPGRTHPVSRHPYPQILVGRGQVHHLKTITYRVFQFS